MADNKQHQHSTTRDAHADASPRLSGRQKAAVWILSLEEDAAVRVVSSLSESEFSKLSSAVKSLKNLSVESIGVVHQQLQDMIGSPTLRLHGREEYLNQVGVRALGKVMTQRASLPGQRDDKASALEDADTEMLASMLKKEHPQLVAAVLSAMPPPRASTVLKALPPESHAEIVSRIAKLHHVPRHALEKVEKVLAAGLPQSVPSDEKFDGTRAVASILNQIGKEQSGQILGSLASDAQLVTHIRDAMFTFEDLASLKPRDFQILLKEVAGDQLIVALKVATPALREAVMNSISKRAAQMLADDIEAMGPVRLSTVEEAQRGIVGAALKLQTEGKLVLGGDSSDAFV